MARARPLLSAHTACRVLGISLLLLATGCSTYSSTAMEVRAKASSGDLLAARQVLEKQTKDDKPDVLNLLERALLLFYEGQYAASNELLQSADLLIEDLYTKSVTAETLAFLTNDGTLPYTAYPHERVLLHIYGALNYLAMGDEENALVECRRVGLRLAAMEDLRSNKEGYSDDAFAQWLSAILFAQAGDGNSALVAARRAQGAFQEYSSLFGVAVPQGLVEDHVEWAQRFGFDQEASEIAAEWDIPTPEPLSRDQGEVLLIYESGFVSHLVENRLSFPILKDDDKRSDDDFAEIVYLRGPRGRLHLTERQKKKLEYWVEVAFPSMTSTVSHYTHARMVSNGLSQSTQVVEDVSALARLTFDEGATNRAIRTIARGVAKYATVNALESDDKPLRWLANAIVGLSERADTRSWSMLPDRIHVARLRLPTGIHPVVVEVLDTQGRVAETATFERVQVVPQGITVLHYRTYH